MPKPRPGLPLTDIERVTGLLGDIVDALESLQATNPSPALEPVICDARFARDSLARITAAHLDALEEFVREHQVTKPEEENPQGGELMSAKFDDTDFDIIRMVGISPAWRTDPHGPEPEEVEGLVKRLPEGVVSELAWEALSGRLEKLYSFGGWEPLT